MGTSRGSSTIKSVFKSIFEQLDVIIENKQKFKENTNEFEQVHQFKEKLIKKMKLFTEKYPNRKIVILLDSIDQLSKQDYDLEWMFYELPKNVKIIYSVINEYEGIFEKLKNKLDNNYLEIKTLCYDEAQRILTRLLLKSNRQLNDQQCTSINKVFETTTEIYPLHVKLLYDISSKWTSSYKVPNEFSDCISSKETIKYLLKNLEKFYGKILFSHCIFYLTNIYHHPSVRRFPIALWVRIKYELKDYITNKETDGVPVISW